MRHLAHLEHDGLLLGSQRAQRRAVRVLLGFGFEPVKGGLQKPQFLLAAGLVARLAGCGSSRHAVIGRTRLPNRRDAEHRDRGESDSD